MKRREERGFVYSHPPSQLLMVVGAFTLDVKVSVKNEKSRWHPRWHPMF
jgi:hypothetical protein